MRDEETKGGLVMAVILSLEVLLTMFVKDSQALEKLSWRCFRLDSPMMERKAGLRSGRWPYPRDKEDPVMKWRVGWRS